VSQGTGALLRFLLSSTYLIQY